LALYFAYFIAEALVIGLPAGFMTPDLPVPWQTPVFIGVPLLAPFAIDRIRPPAIRRLEKSLFFATWDIATPPTP
jgi:hypothetical protein